MIARNGSFVVVMGVARNPRSAGPKGNLETSVLDTNNVHQTNASGNNVFVILMEIVMGLIIVMLQSTKEVSSCHKRFAIPKSPQGRLAAGMRTVCQTALVQLTGVVAPLAPPEVAPPTTIIVDNCKHR